MTLTVEWIDRGLALVKDKDGNIFDATKWTGYACGDYKPHYPVPATIQGVAIGPCFVQVVLTDPEQNYWNAPWWYVPSGDRVKDNWTNY